MSLRRENQGRTLVVRLRGDNAAAAEAAMDATGRSGDTDISSSGSDTTDDEGLAEMHDAATAAAAAPEKEGGPPVGEAAHDELSAFPPEDDAHGSTLRSVSLNSSSSTGPVCYPQQPAPQGSVLMDKDTAGHPQQPAPQGSVLMNTTMDTAGQQPAPQGPVLTETTIGTAGHPQHPASQDAVLVDTTMDTMGHPQHPASQDAVLVDTTMDTMGHPQQPAPQGPVLVASPTSTDTAGHHPPPGAESPLRGCKKLFFNDDVSMPLGSRSKRIDGMLFILLPEASAAPVLAWLPKTAVLAEDPELLSSVQASKLGKLITKSPELPAKDSEYSTVVPVASVFSATVTGKTVDVNYLHGGDPMRQSVVSLPLTFRTDKLSRHAEASCGRAAAPKSTMGDFVALLTGLVPLAPQKQPNVWVRTAVVGARAAAAAQNESTAGPAHRTPGLGATPQPATAASSAAPRREGGGGEEAHDGDMNWYRKWMYDQQPDPSARSNPVAEISRTVNHLVGFLADAVKLPKADQRSRSRTPEHQQQHPPQRHTPPPRAEVHGDEYRSSIPAPRLPPTTRRRTVPLSEERLSELVLDVVTEMHSSPFPRRGSEAAGSPAVSPTESRGRQSAAESTSYDVVKDAIFCRGVEPGMARRVAWRYVMGMDPLRGVPGGLSPTACVEAQREYPVYQSQHSLLTERQRKHWSWGRQQEIAVDKDVFRTDRDVPLFAGEGCEGLQKIRRLLIAYCMYNRDLGYVQGMSDIAAVCVYVFANPDHNEDEEEHILEAQAFAGFCWILDRMLPTLDDHGAEARRRLRTLVSVLNPGLAKHLDLEDADSMFAFRWIFLLFKREFKFVDVLKLWDIIFSAPTPRYHLVVAAALLDKLGGQLHTLEGAQLVRFLQSMQQSVSIDEVLLHAEDMWLKICDNPQAMAILDG
ncbi:GTPase-activating protein GYP7 [Diplonema papillatum]|nr:GTPase-activating protein GYP7 [Diplonema papillatum]